MVFWPPNIWLYVQTAQFITNGCCGNVVEVHTYTEMYHVCPVYAIHYFIHWDIFFLNKNGIGTLKWGYFKVYELRNRLSFITIQINVLVQYIFSCLILNDKPVGFFRLKTV